MKISSPQWNRVITSTNRNRHTRAKWRNIIATSAWCMQRSCVVYSIIYSAAQFVENLARCPGMNSVTGAFLGFYLTFCLRCDGQTVRMPKSSSRDDKAREAREARSVWITFANCYLLVAFLLTPCILYLMLIIIIILVIIIIMECVYYAC